jgi:hypothetical protein
MNRRTLISLHLFLSAFLGINILIVAISGGLYLFGNKGTTTEELLGSLPKGTFSVPSVEDHTAIAAMLTAVGVVDPDFEYAKKSGSGLITRPTSRAHYVVKDREAEIEIYRATPDWVGVIVELHKGHGPTAFKWYSKAFALGVVLIILSGLWLGLTSPMLKGKTMVLSGAGTALVLLLAML